MPVEVGLSDGTRLVLADPNESVDEVLRHLEGRRGIGGAVQLHAKEGRYLVMPAQVVYVREVESSEGA